MYGVSGLQTTYEVFMANLISQIPKRDEQTESNYAWEHVRDTFNTVITLDKVNPKAIRRTGNQMKKALADLFDALRIYDHMRGKK